MDGNRRAALAALFVLVGASAFVATNAGARPDGPRVAFVDVDNDGQFTAVDYEFDISQAARADKRISVNLDTEGFVIPAGVGRVNAEWIEITTESGRIEVGPGVKLNASDGVTLYARTTIVGDGATITANQGYVDLDGRETVVIGNQTSIKAGGGIETGNESTLMIGKGASLKARDGDISLDPRHVFMIGTGADLVADGIDIGVGYGAEPGEATSFVIEENVSFVGTSGAWIGAWGNSPMVYPNGTTITSGGHVDLVAESGPLTVDNAKIKARDVLVRSNHSATFADADFKLEKEAELIIRGMNTQAPKTGHVSIDSDSKVNLGRDGLLDVYAATADIDEDALGPASKTVIVNGQGAGPRARTLTVEVTGANGADQVAITPVGIQCVAATDLCTATLAADTNAWVKPAGTPQGVVGGDCLATNGYVRMTDNKTCTVRF